MLCCNKIKRAFLANSRSVGKVFTNHRRARTDNLRGNWTINVWERELHQQIALSYLNLYNESKHLPYPLRKITLIKLIKIDTTVTKWVVIVIVTKGLWYQYEIYFFYKLLISYKDPLLRSSLWESRSFSLDFWHKLWTITLKYYLIVSFKLHNIVYALLSAMRLLMIYLYLIRTLLIAH